MTCPRCGREQPAPHSPCPECVMGLLDERLAELDEVPVEEMSREGSIIHLARKAELQHLRHLVERELS